MADLIKKQALERAQCALGDLREAQATAKRRADFHDKTVVTLYDQEGDPDAGKAKELSKELVTLYEKIELKRLEAVTKRETARNPLDNDALGELMCKPIAQIAHPTPPPTLQPAAQGPQGGQQRQDRQARGPGPARRRRSRSRSRSRQATRSRSPSRSRNQRRQQFTSRNDSNSGRRSNQRSQGQPRQNTSRQGQRTATSRPPQARSQGSATSSRGPSTSASSSSVPGAQASTPGMINAADLIAAIQSLSTGTKK